MCRSTTPAGVLFDFGFKLGPDDFLGRKVLFSPSPKLQISFEKMGIRNSVL